MTKTIDCVVVGSCVVDVLARPVPLSAAIGAGRLMETEPLVLTTGGIVSNAGITMARLGMRVRRLLIWATTSGRRWCGGDLRPRELIRRHS